ncbi:MAG: WYL domain-containing protein [Nitrospiraceae bacterium]|nr:MAG: WYL domain-containing protein [Nitrospiraceae bacterium]
MGNKAIYERFAWFDSKVRAGKHPNATMLAGKFEISVKTAQRDIEFMRDRIRCPLVYDKSRKGYYYENDSFSLPITYLSGDELTMLLLARKLLQDINGEYIKNELSAIMGKITGILEKHMEKADVIDQALSFQFIQYSPVEEEVFKSILEACLKRNSLKFSYYSPAKDEHTERMVDPYHLLNYMGTWHLIAYCQIRGDIRDFVLTRMSNLELTDSKFTFKKDFNLKAFLQASFGIYKGKRTEMVTLRFSPKRSRWIKNQIWQKDQKVRILDDGSLELSFPVASFMEIEMEVLSHGHDVEVIAPQAFRALIKAEAVKIAGIY